MKPTVAVEIQENLLSSVFFTELVSMLLVPISLDNSLYISIRSSADAGASGDIPPGGTFVFH